MQWYQIVCGSAPKGVGTFETQALDNTHLDFHEVPPRYRSGDCACTWDEGLADDAFSWFGEHGGLKRANGQRFYDLIVSRGNTQDCCEMFRKFRGRDPNIGPLLEEIGLQSTAKGATP